MASSSKRSPRSSRCPNWGSFIVSPVRNQKKDICWAVGMSAAVEGKTNKKKTSRMSLSSQFLINEFGHDSVKGLKNVDNFLKEVGIPEEHACTFLGRRVDHPPKVRNVDMVKVASSVYEILGSKAITEGYIMKLLEEGPVVGALECTRRLIDLKKGEIYTPPPPLKGRETHCVFITQYGEEKGSSYWVCRESRGPMHGDDGYIRVERKKDEHAKSAFLEIWVPTDISYEPYVVNKRR